MRITTGGRTLRMEKTPDGKTKLVRVHTYSSKNRRLKADRLAKTWKQKGKQG